MRILDRGIAVRCFLIFIPLITLFLSCRSKNVSTKADELLVVAHSPENKFYQTMIHDFIMGVARDQYTRRHNAVKNLINARELTHRQKYLRERLLEMIGGLPERTPLNARVVGRIEKGDVVIEKILYESLPRFYVTGLLYLPKNRQARVPAIFSPCGHSENGKAYEVYQRFHLSLAKRGFAVLTIDPLGQGERSQCYDHETKKSPLGLACPEHGYVGNPLYLVGDNLARYRVWDGMRGIDYLQTRPEVDPNKIGVTGQSGGGTLTAYISALDERVKVSMPVCYVTSLYWRMGNRTTADPEWDPEQDLFETLMDGVDHAELLTLFSPKPLRIGAAQQDFFPIEGTRATYEEVRRIYELTESESKIDKVEVNGKHSLSAGLRQASYEWFERWLLNKRGSSAEPEVTPEDERNLLCTGSGQVLESLGGETIQSLNRQRLARLKFAPPVISSAEALAGLQDRLRRDVHDVLNDPMEPQSQMTIQRYGSLDRDGYTIEKLVYESEPGIRIPTLIFKTKIVSDQAPVILYLHELGKAPEAREGGLLERLTKAGFLVCAIDPRGLGETQYQIQGKADYFQPISGVETNMTYNSFLVGRPMLAMRIKDALRAVDLLSQRPDANPSQIYVLGEDGGGIMAQFVAALDRRVAGVAAVNTLLNYRQIIETGNYAIHVSLFLPQILRHFDLPELAVGIAPRPLLLLDSRDPMRKPLLEKTMRQELQLASQTYRMLGAGARLSLQTTSGRNAQLQAVIEWLSRLN
jgi:cephalosporin-C deacetylase-like acetyl esterase